MIYWLSRTSPYSGVSNNHTLCVFPRKILPCVLITPVLSIVIKEMIAVHTHWHTFFEKNIFYIQTLWNSLETDDSIKGCIWYSTNVFLQYIRKRVTVLSQCTMTALFVYFFFFLNNSIVLRDNFFYKILRI